MLAAVTDARVMSLPHDRWGLAVRLTEEPEELLAHRTP